VRRLPKIALSLLTLVAALAVAIVVYLDAIVGKAIETGCTRALGVETRVGERGATLSGGQRQRLALARAVVRRPRLLGLDDATSAVDPAVEARILDALRGGEEPATVVVIAYRQATIALADEVVWLAGGRIVDQGAHADLLARNPAYAELVNAYDTDDTDPADAADTALVDGTGEVGLR